MLWQLSINIFFVRCGGEGKIIGIKIDFGYK
jgi:hypothetical protein